MGAESWLWEFALFCRDFEIFQIPKLHSEFTGGSLLSLLKAHLSLQFDSKFASTDSQAVLMMISSVRCLQHTL